MIKRGHGGFIFFATLLVMVLSGEEVRHRRYTSAQGLSENAVTSLFQDRKGFLWVGTQDGLNRFDGSGFLALRSELTDTSTLSDSWVNGILLGGSLGGDQRSGHQPGGPEEPEGSEAYA